ncbi:HTH-type transcriptional regulator EthR [Mycolicibacterium madagascariense]|uniref:HTH-type transcriptional regulator EthR n=1 Tax=Mycolicibacterium madagascariense TaxID=212765 RepID=A0A7I7XNU3_9MYCO|nr:TetR/AcrR family transcriptional regulator [Mycolicibacterium madagascariense]MCV7012003.1 TetR/AcrR family transcriptional regulator [Mycolicibacterium madagascariense]BBZ30921.1 HTH-type transcriptional regulator EthR [Mycolicibacterium madagascariense]
MTTTSAAKSGRARRSTRPSGDDREAAILATAERLLADKKFADISVDDLAKGAGLSRPTFYFYFPSKEAVLLALFERVIIEADSALEALTADPPAEPKALWRHGIDVFVRTFGTHRAVSLAAERSRATEEISELWSRFMQKWVTHSAAIIDVERARGAAPQTLPAVELSTALNLLNEKVMLTSFAGEVPSIPAERVLDTLVHIWMTSIYGAAQ